MVAGVPPRTIPTLLPLARPPLLLADAEEEEDEDALLRATPGCRPLTDNEADPLLSRVSFMSLFSLLRTSPTYASITTIRCELYFLDLYLNTPPLFSHMH